MDACIRSARDLFQKPIRYLVPNYQRPYVWEEQWQPFWEDVQRIAESKLEDDLGAGDVDEVDHFLGAIVLQQELSATGDLAERLVIDGQQRLLTLQLLLDAAQEVLADLDADVQATARRLSHLVLNDEDYLDPSDSDSCFKIWPTLSDRDPFRQAMTNGAPSDDHQDSKIVLAHEYFREQVRDWLSRDTANVKQRAASLEKALREQCKFVTIDLGPADNPNLIFETLNARGTPLLAWDLVKNYVLHEERMAGGDDERLFDDHLSRLDEDSWWREDIRQGRLYRTRIDVYLNYWLIARTQKNIPADEVFSKFRDHARNKGMPQLVTDMVSLAESYRLLERTADGSVLGRFLARWRVLQAGILTPTLLWLLSSNVPADRFARCLWALESYLVRRMICRMGTMGLNRSFLTLLSQLEHDGPATADETVIGFLRAQQTVRTLWPGDDLFRAELTDARLFRLLNQSRIRLLLEALEERLRTGMAETQRVPARLTIEHIMPQHWAAHWPAPQPALAGEEDAMARRERLVQSLGNLTLVNKKLNPSMSNAGWSTKRDALAAHSTLFLNKRLLDEVGPTWDELAILTRGKALAELAIEIWPPPDKI